MKRGSVVELRAVPGEYAVDAECGGGEAAAEATMDGGEGLLQIVGRHKLAGNITAADQIVDIFKQRFDAGIEFIQVGDDRNFGGARPSGGLGGSRGVVAVKVKRARVDDPIALQFFRAKGEAVVAPPQDGALARIVHKDEGLLTGAIRRGEQMRFNAEAREFRSVQRSRAAPKSRFAPLPFYPAAKPPPLSSPASSGDSVRATSARWAGTARLRCTLRWRFGRRVER